MKNGDCEPADPTCTHIADSIQLNGAAIAPDHLVHLPGERDHKIPYLSIEISHRVREVWMDLYCYQQESCMAF